MIYEAPRPRRSRLALNEATKRIAVGGYDGRVTIYKMGDSCRGSY